MTSVYRQVLDFKNRHPGTISWRLKAHCKVIERHLNNNEKVTYAFACQKNESSVEIFSTYVIAITTERIILAQKRLLFGYLFISITPDMYNDITVHMGILWGKIYIDTIKEVVKISNLSKHSLPEIESKITEFMIKAKKEYGSKTV